MRFRHQSGRVRAIRFAAKHAVAAAVVVGGITILTATSYFALLIWAALTGQPLGGPLAFPFLVLFALAASVVCVAVILLPTTALTEWMCLKRDLRVAIQIPLSVACLGAYVLVGALLMALLSEGSLAIATKNAAIVFVMLLVPLGAYWWSMQSTDWILGWALAWWSGRIRPRSE
jgi:hypothetical protein